MGEGGVACVPLQIIMEKFPGSNGKLETMPVKKTTTKRMKLKRDAFFKKEEPVKTEIVSEKVKSSVEVVENGEKPKEDVEEGELGTLKSPKKEVENGELTPRKALKSEIEKKDIVSSSDKRRKDEPVKGEVLPVRRRKNDTERVEFGSSRLRSDVVVRMDRTPEKCRKAEYEKVEFGAWRGCKDEVEKGEFIPDRWHKVDAFRDEYGYSKGSSGGGRRHDSSRERERRYERDWTPSSSKYSGEDISPERDYIRRGHNNRHSKRAARWEANQERSNYPKLSSKILDEAVPYKNEQSHSRNYPLGSNRLKRYGTDSDSSDHRKYYDDHGEYVSSKSRRLSGDSYRTAHSDYYTRQSVEKSYRNQSPNYVEKSYRNHSPNYVEKSYRNSSRTGSDRPSMRHHESSSNRGVHDRYKQRSPSYSERSPPRERAARYHDHRDRTPARHERSPCFRIYRHDNRNQSPPSYVERSSQERVRPSLDHRRDRSPSYLDQSPHDRSRPSGDQRWGANRKNDVSEPKQTDRVQEDKHTDNNSNSKDSIVSTKDPIVENDNSNGSTENNVLHETPTEDQPHSPNIEEKEQPSLVEGIIEELPSMEEDMDICDTPPHVPSVVNVIPGKWYYIDQFGEERGPSRLCDLKALMKEGMLQSDHLVKHSDSDRWVTVENAASPMSTPNYSTIFPDSVTQLVSPPEAPGNVLVDAGDVDQIGDLTAIRTSDTSVIDLNIDINLPPEDLNIDERVGALLDGKTVIPGKELEIVGEVLQITFDQSMWERFGYLEGLMQDHPNGEILTEQTGNEDLPKCSETPIKDGAESTSAASFDKDCGYLLGEFTEWFSGWWSCKGGDWQKNEEAVQDKFFKRKLVLNDGYPLCLMPKSGHEDPRWQRKDDLYFPCQSRKLDLPPWAVSWPDERNDATNKPVQSKPVAVRGVKGIMLPVIRINACVVKDHGSSGSDSRLKLRTKDKHLSKGSKHYSLSSDVNKSSGEDSLHFKNKEQSSAGSWKSHIINIPKDRLCSVDELQLHLGDWYYLDGTGHEHGPFSCSTLLTLVEEGSLKKQSSVFRKLDKLWVPVTAVVKAFKDNVNATEVNAAHAGVTSGAIDLGSSCSFDNMYPQFIGFTRGKLHELVMKSYKSREFAAAINVVLDPWMNSRQLKKESEKHLQSKPASKSSHYIHSMDNGVSLHEDDIHARKRCRISIDGIEEGYEMERGLPSLCFKEPSFEDLCCDAVFHKDESGSENQVMSWGLLDGHILARIFHFLRADVKSLIFAALTCKHWNAAVGFYKNVSIHIDLSTFGINCTDSVFWSIMNGYNKQMIKALVLAGCTNVTSVMLEEILQSFSHISSVDIKGCNQFEEVIVKFPHVNWVGGRTSKGVTIVDDSSLKARSLKQMAEQTLSSTKLSHGSHIDESSGLKDYFDMVDKRGAANQAFRQSLYKRAKLFDARKSASVLAREARLRHWAMKKAGSGYRKNLEFLAVNLKAIMKGKSSDYFAPKVAEIENRIKSGYYARRGLNSAKQDIIKMCREATKMKNHDDEGDMENMITSFIKLGTGLDERFKTVIDKDETSGSTGKRNPKVVTDKRFMSRANGSFYVNGDINGIECTSEREFKKNLSKLNKKIDSDSDSSDEFELSSDDTESDAERDSDTDSDSDIRTRATASESKEGYFTVDESLELIPDDREWGARMTKASLVPPVTRKYEVIDQYVIVADEVEVQRKMRVALPDDYEEKVNTQKIGCEVDMEIPEVKEYKPRKQLGEEVIEQEVYGIDPYTHNLLLDSIPEGVDWSHAEKHVFIEDVLLRALNKQVRRYTGSRSTPMTYPLRPVIEEILETAKQEHDMRVLKLCEALLQAIESRLEDNYAAYRKGLGVVCNKQGGFTVDDFVVEFLGEVYPAWKWFEKQDGIRSLQRHSKEPAPEFYNIYMERPKGDADGYDLVVVDAMHKANYASRICHSCRPNCEAKVTAVGGQYQIGIYSLRPIAFSEEVTFDYNSVTESKEEYEASVCLCGSQVCRGSYLNLTGEGAFQKVLKEWHGLLDKHRLLLEACELNWVSEEDYIELGKAGLGGCLLGGLPDWLIAYSARLVRFMNFERSKLPEEILKHNLEEKRKYFTEISIEMEKSDAEVQAEGVYNQRLQNLALTLDKVRYVLRCVFGDPKEAPPPLQKLTPEEMVCALWNGESSLVNELLECISPHVDDWVLQDLRLKIRAHDPSTSSNTEKELRKSLLWLRDEVRNLQCTYKSRHDAAADLIHIYAYTKFFFKIREYKSVTSPPVYISPLDLGPKCANKLSGVTEYCKTYGANYCLGQLIYWHNQAHGDPDRVLARSSRGCLSLPEISSFYAKAQKPSRQRVYGPRTVRFMLARMENQPQRPWPTDRIWSFKSSPTIFGSPMLDAAVNNSSLEREMAIWLKNRPAIFQAMWDR